jgi:hypothetical protein
MGGEFKSDVATSNSFSRRVRMNYKLAARCQASHKVDENFINWVVHFLVLLGTKN